MLYNDFCGEKNSALGLGLMRLPVIDGKESQIDVQKAEEMIAYAMEKGIRYYDTAWGYHGGTSESVCGEILSKYPRETFFLTSKFPGYDNSNMPKAKEIFEKQLEKCCTDYFDFYLIHNVYEGNIDDYLDPKIGIIDYFVEQKKAGRIKHLGFSFHGAFPVLERFVEACGEHMEFAQLQLNYMDWHFQNCDEKYAYCEKKGLPLIVMEPMRGGKLANIPEDMAAELKKMRPEASPAEWAFRFLQALPQVKLVLTGASNMEQISENIALWGEEKPITEEEFNKLVELADIESAKIGVPCTKCNYCASHCPMELPISLLLEYYNEHKSNAAFLAPMAVEALPEEKRPDKCIGCRSCEEVCPQQIKISEVFAEFVQMPHMQE